MPYILAKLPAELDLQWNGGQCMAVVEEFWSTLTESWKGKLVLPSPLPSPPLIYTTAAACPEHRREEALSAFDLARAFFYFIAFATAFFELAAVGIVAFFSPADGLRRDP